MPATHRESHRALLRRPGSGPARDVDAIIVPAHRPAHHLGPAAQLAIELACPLYLMCDPSGTDPFDFAVRAHPGLDWRAVTVPDGYQHPMLPGSALPRPDVDDWRHGALSTKRNLGVLISRLLRLRTVLLVDDDIVGLEAVNVLRAAEGLAGLRAVGLEVADYPDNSVVCHANRLSRQSHQDVFVGACALVLDIARPVGFFPRVYNEDWLFLFDHVANRAVGRVGAVGQQPYDPFTDPARARAEEFGEVLAEGLMSALHDMGSGGLPLGLPYWQDFLRARAEFIERAATGLPPDDPGIDSSTVLRSLTAARTRLDGIDAKMCVDFVRGWRADLLVWHAGLVDLPAVESFEAAVNHLDLTSSLAGLIA